MWPHRRPTFAACLRRPATLVVLVKEVSEHARWAQERVREDASHTYLALSAFSAATGRAGRRSNAFLEGFLNSVTGGECSDSLDEYLRVKSRLVTKDKLGWVRDSTVVDALRAWSVEVLQPETCMGIGRSCARSARPTRRNCRRSASRPTRSRVTDRSKPRRTLPCWSSRSVPVTCTFQAFRGRPAPSSSRKRALHR